MSLAALAIRLATIRALKGRTFAGDRVFDSKIDPLDLVIQQESGLEFVIVVTTDGDEVAVEGRDMRAGDHQLELVIEVAATARLAVEAKDDGDVLVIPATDAGLEATLNLIGWQIMRALQADGGPWADLWRRLVMRIQTATSNRGADEANGVRYAARQIILTLEHVAEPEPGVAPAPGDLWADVIEMLKDDDELSAIGRIIETTITADVPEPWERVRASLGLADDESTWVATREFAQDSGSDLDGTKIELSAADVEDE